MFVMLDMIAVLASSIVLTRFECLNILSKLFKFVLSKLIIALFTNASNSPFDYVVSFSLYLNVVVTKILTISASTITGLTVNILS